MTTLVRRGTARRLGLRRLRPQLGGVEWWLSEQNHVRQQWARVHLEWTVPGTFPATGPEWWLDETRIG